MIEGGKMVFSDSMEAFNNYIEATSLLVSLDVPPNLGALKAIPGVLSVEHLHGKTFRLRFSGSSRITDDIVQLSVKNGWHLTEISLEKSSLEEVFAQLSKKSRNS